MRAEIPPPGVVAVLGALIVGLLGGNVAFVSAARTTFAPSPTVTEPAINLVSLPSNVAAAVRDTCVPAPLADRAAAVLVVGLPHVYDAGDPLAREVVGLGVGGVLITKANVASAEQVTELISGLRRHAPRSLVVTTDEEPGRVSSFGAVLGRTSSARTLAARHQPREVRALARELAADLRAFGVDLALAPVADLDDGPSAGVIGDRSFSGDPEVATAFVRAFAGGLARGGVLPAVKHFPGHGRSSVDSHVDLAVVETTMPRLRRHDLVPFADQIQRGVPVVMLAHVAFPALGDDLPASLSPGAYELLRSMGFHGVAMTDSVGMGAINLRWDFPEAAVQAVAAGADAVLVTDGGQAERMRDALVAAVGSGALDERRLDEAVARMRRLAGADPRELVCLDVPFPRLPARTAAADDLLGCRRAKQGDVGWRACDDEDRGADRRR